MAVRRRPGPSGSGSPHRTRTTRAFACDRVALLRPNCISAPGEEIQFRLSSATLSQANARVVRVRCGDPDPLGPGLRLTAMEADLNGPLDLQFQPIHPGSYAVIDDRPIF